MQVWLNGEFVDFNAATISVFDAGLQHGVGLFETMNARHGRLFRLDAHMERLAGSARTLLLSESLRTGPLAEAAERTVTQNGFESARVRVTLTGGDLSGMQTQGAQRQDPSILIVAQPPTPYPEAFFEAGVTAVIAEGRRNPFDPMAGHKTLNYWANIRALQLAAAQSAGEAIWLTVTNHLACGSVSNVFIVKDNTLVTPFARGEEPSNGIPSPVLPGITRAAIIELAAENGNVTERRMVEGDELLAADEVFLTNASWGVLPVVAVGQQKIGTGGVGAVTRRMREAWLGLVERETALGL